jgi:hypothetical protein
MVMLYIVPVVEGRYRDIGIAMGLLTTMALLVFFVL